MFAGRLLSFPIRTTCAMARRRLSILHGSCCKKVVHRPGTPCIFTRNGGIIREHTRTLWQLRLRPNHEEDGVREEDQLVYLDWNRKELVWGSVFVSFGVTACVIKACVDVASAKIHLAGLPTLQILIGICIPSAWLLITFLQNRLFVWMYYNYADKKFTAVGIDRRLKKVKLEFNTSDVQPIIGGPWKTRGGNYYIKGKPYFIIEPAFLKPEYWNIFRNKNP